jgi:hypothetical protein
MDLHTFDRRARRRRWIAKIGAATTLVISLFGCGKHDAQQVAKEPEKASDAQVQATPKTPQHAYDIQDGMEYGYTAATSQASQNAGQAGSQVTMFLYAGKQGDKYQLHYRQGAVLTAIECSVPCEVLKFKVAMDLPGTRVPPTIQRFRPEPNAIALLALQDAANGFLKQYGVEKQGKKYTVWVDDERGIVKTVFKD